MRWWVVAVALAIGCGDENKSGDTAGGEGSDPAECNDGVDNDGDGLADCQDDGCATAPTCLGAPETVEDATCADGVDNDLDGLVDCDDGDCAPGWCACANFADVYAACLVEASLDPTEYEDPDGVCAGVGDGEVTYYNCLALAYDVDCSSSDALINAGVAAGECG
jgi:hypothetical protein